MADSNDLAVVRHGTATIAEWRTLNPRTQLDLSQGSLSGMELAHADLSGADLFGADLDGTNLDGASLEKAVLTGASMAGATLKGGRLGEAMLARANLHGAHLEGANLAKANMATSNLVGSNFTRAILESANLDGADLDDADFTGAVLARADLVGADLVSVVLTDVDLSGARMGTTSIAGCDLSSCRGLGTVEHVWPSSVGVDTLVRTLRGLGGKWTPETLKFFMGAGVPATLLDQVAALAAVRHADFTACLITHAAADAALATRLRDSLSAAGLRCYLHQEVSAGPTMFASMDRATPIYDKLVVLCSKDGLQRSHVLREMEQALHEEGALMKRKETDPTVDAAIVYLLRLDEYLDASWQHPLKEESLRHHVGDLRGWDKDETVYQRELAALIASLRPAHQT